MFVDLHAHTTASDGSLAPAALVRLAGQVGLAAVGITDHDTIGGWEEALAAGADDGLEIVPGVELSTSYAGGRCHILGYYIRPASLLTATLERIQRGRHNRNGHILENLRALDMPLDEAELRLISGSATGQIGRPHFALAMVERGYVTSTQEAFDLYLADGKPGYAHKEVLSPQDAIGQIHDAGGVAIWAHPVLGRTATEVELDALLDDLVGWGLDGLETQYARYTPEQAQRAEAMRARHDLLEAGGSDFHGVSKPDVKLGVTNTGQGMPIAVLDAIKARRYMIRSAQMAAVEAVS